MMNCSTVIYNIELLDNSNLRALLTKNYIFNLLKKVIDRAVHYNIKHFILMSANGVKEHGTGYQSTKY